MQLVSIISQVLAWHFSLVSINIRASGLPSGTGSLCKFYLHLKARYTHTKKTVFRHCYTTRLYSKDVFAFSLKTTCWKRPSECKCVLQRAKWGIDCNSPAFRDSVCSASQACFSRMNGSFSGNPNYTGW